MVTLARVQALPYPQTYRPAVAGTAEHRHVLLVETEAGPEGVAVHPFLLCQDWDGRVVVHWEDDRGSYTYTVLDIVVDTDERFEFAREDAPQGRVWLTPLTYPRFEREFRSRHPEAANGAPFESEEQFRRWYLPG